VAACLSREDKERESTRGACTGKRANTRGADASNKIPMRGH
jgi:hypothetical protein